MMEGQTGQRPATRPPSLRPASAPRKAPAPSPGHDGAKPPWPRGIGRAANPPARPRVVEGIVRGHVGAESASQGVSTNAERMSLTATKVHTKPWFEIIAWGRALLMDP